MPKCPGCLLRHRLAANRVRPQSSTSGARPLSRVPACAVTGCPAFTGHDKGVLHPVEARPTTASRREPHDRHHRHHRPRNPRQPRQSDRRGRRRARGRLAGAAPRCRPAPRPARTRRSSCATATRHAISARACARRSTPSTARSSTRVGGMDAEAQAKIDETLIALDGTPNKAGSAPMPSSASRWRWPRPPPPRIRRRSIAMSAAPRRGCCRCR